MWQTAAVIVPGALELFSYTLCVCYTRYCPVLAQVQVHCFPGLYILLVLFALAHAFAHKYSILLPFHLLLLLMLPSRVLKVMDHHFYGAPAR